ANNYIHGTPDDDSGDNSLQAPDNVLGDNGSGWTLASATPGAINSGQTSGDISLPVELSYFSASPKNGNVLLKWATESEIENLGFILERKMLSSAVIQWTEIASFITHSELQGQGSVTYRTDYEFIDRDVAIGKTYSYRLVDVDHHGVKTIHPERSVFISSSSIILHKPFPNPFNPSTSFTVFFHEKSSISIKIIDSLGREINSLAQNKIFEMGPHQFHWNGKTKSGDLVSSGTYFIRIESGENILSEKLFLIR
ncbi:MAG: T9SS type A sorting domain-containing protein, partial [Candidatus Marinimicrobia bacterium]|nr:T9SS type A sorting domain-containing protein [Candidatus Neomarinimicrobiota bacterium]